MSFAWLIVALIATTKCMYELNKTGEHSIGNLFYLPLAVIVAPVTCALAWNVEQLQWVIWLLRWVSGESVAVPQPAIILLWALLTTVGVLLVSLFVAEKLS